MTILELADELQRLCCAETEGRFFDCVTDNIDTIIAALRSASPAGNGGREFDYGRWQTMVHTILREELNTPSNTTIYFGNAIERILAAIQVALTTAVAPDGAREALEPFAKLFTTLEGFRQERGDNWPSDEVEFIVHSRSGKDRVDFTFGDLRRAHAALARHPPPADHSRSLTALASW